MLPDSILIIDSDDAVLNAFGKSLGRQGFVVYGTTSALEGRQVLQTQQPQALILDIQFPEPQGVELLREAKILYPALPIIVITRYSTSFTAADAKREGADGYFVKPFDPRALLEKIQALTFTNTERSAKDETQYHSRRRHHNNGIRIRLARRRIQAGADESQFVELRRHVGARKFPAGREVH